MPLGSDGKPIIIDYPEDTERTIRAIRIANEMGASLFRVKAEIGWVVNLRVQGDIGDRVGKCRRYITGYGGNSIINAYLDFLEILENRPPMCDCDSKGESDVQ
jgi:hypothetical protein